MTEPRQIAIVRDYDGLIAALRSRATDLGATRKQISDISGLPDGYASTLLAPTPIKSLGKTSLGPMLGALGLMLIVVEDAVALKLVQERLGGANASYARNGALRAPVIFKNSKAFYSKIGRKGARARKSWPAWKRRAAARKAARALNRQLSPQQRSESAKRAATTRWERVRAAEAETCQARGNAPIAIAKHAKSPGKTAICST